MSETNQISEIKNFINGEWIVNTGLQSVPLKNPSTGEVISKVPMSTPEVSNQAVQAAADAYPAWRSTPLPKRMDYIFKIYTAMQDNLEELAQAIAIDQAKHISEARGEVGRVIEIVQMACSIPSLMQG